MRRELKVRTERRPDIYEIPVHSVAKFFPMRRELKAASNVHRRRVGCDVAKFFPMRRELKGFVDVITVPRNSKVAKFFPMRRELKGPVNLNRPSL